MNRRRSWNEDNDKSRKRRRVESEPEAELEDRLESLIVRVGEKSSSSLEENLKDLAEILDNDLTKSKTKIITIICECVAEIPEKNSIYATLIGLLNVKNYSFGGEIVEMLVKNFKDYLKACQWEKARSSVRLFGDLVNCHVISCGSLLSMFESLADVTMEDNIPQARSDFFIYSLLSALPWVGRELYEKKEQDLDMLLNTIDNYISKRSKAHHTSLRVWYSDSPHPQEEYLDCLWAQISKLRTDKWVEKHIYRPYLSFDNILCEALQHNLPQIHPAPHDSSYVYPYPKVVFRLFNYTDCPDGPVLPPPHSIERFLVEEHITWIIDQYFYDRKECATALLSFPGLHKLPLEYILVEVILANIFYLPVTKHLEVYFGSLLLELCKLQPGTLPQVLAQAAELLFERLDTMNIACVDRFASWFAYHLSNFQFRWTWEDWHGCLSLDPLHPKPKFVRETLNKCIRLSYHERVEELVPESFHTFLPERYVVINKYLDEGEVKLPGTEIAGTLMQSFLKKCTPEEAMEIVKDIPNPLEADGDDPSHNPLKISIFVTILLNVASKSFSHLFSGLSKFSSSLSSLNTCEEAQMCILKAIFEVWKSHQQLMVVLVEKLLKAEVIQHSAVANWVFSKDMSGELMKSYIWEILHCTIKWQVKTVERYTSEVNEAKEKQRKKEIESMEITETENGSNTEKDAQTIKDAPTDEMVEIIEEKLESAESELKNLFLIIFQRFIMLLSEHIQKCEADGKSFKNHWFRCSIGRLQQVFFEHHLHVFKYVSTLESLLFTGDLDQHILLIFKQFCSLRA